MQLVNFFFMNIGILNYFPNLHLSYLCCYFPTALSGVVLYNYLKIREGRASQPPEGIPERVKVSLLCAYAYDFFFSKLEKCKKCPLFMLNILGKSLVNCCTHNLVDPESSHFPFLPV